MKAAVNVIIPALNESAAISKVIGDIPDFVQEIIVVDNGSTDTTAEMAKNAGATVLHESKKGYGHACLKGLDYLKNLDQKTDIVVFLDGDYSDYPEQMSNVIAPITNNNRDFVLGSRKKNLSEKGAMQPQQRFGNWLATLSLIHI